MVKIIEEISEVILIASIIAFFFFNYINIITSHDQRIKHYKE